MKTFTFKRKNGGPMQWELPADNEAAAVAQMDDCFGPVLELVKPAALR